VAPSIALSLSDKGNISRAYVRGQSGQSQTRIIAHIAVSCFEHIGFKNDEIGNLADREKSHHGPYKGKKFHSQQGPLKLNVHQK